MGSTVLPARTIRTSLSVAVGVAIASYPLLVYVVIGQFGPSGAAAMLAVVCAARLVVLKRHGVSSFGGDYFTFVCIGGIVLAGVGFLLDSSQAVLYYPVLVNAGLLAVFGVSLVSPPTVVERIARVRQPDLPHAGIVYTRRVTVAWTVFFALNGAAALYTTLATPLETWALYNGLIAYVLIGALFVIELAVRSRCRARWKQ